MTKPIKGGSGTLSSQLSLTSLFVALGKTIAQIDRAQEDKNSYETVGVEAVIAFLQKQKLTLIAEISKRDEAIKILGNLPVPKGSGLTFQQYLNEETGKGKEVGLGVWEMIILEYIS